MQAVRGEGIDRDNRELGIWTDQVGLFFGIFQPEQGSRRLT